MVDIRYTGKCESHGHVTVGVLADFPKLIEYYANTYLARCPLPDGTGRDCAGTLRLWPVKATRGKKECGAWCTDGTGRKCTCVCEGRNHGSTYSHTGALWYAR